MDYCHKCGQAICQPGYFEGFAQQNGETVRVYTCTDCRQKERSTWLFEKYGWAWPILLFWNNLRSRLVAALFLNSDTVLGFVSGLSNETGLFELKYSPFAGKSNIKMEYRNLGGKVVVRFWDFKKPQNTTMEAVFDKFTLKLIKVVSVQGDYPHVVKLAKSMTELLESGVEFEKKLCHC